MKQLLLKSIFFFTILTSLSSCVQYESLLYFRKDVVSSRPQFSADTIQNLVALRIQKNDVLSITVNTFDSELSAPFNLISSQLAGAAGASGAVSPYVSYIVDENGEIDFPVLGKINIEGKTANQARVEIKNRLMTYLKDPVVNIRFVNFRISVLGEVSKPGTFIITNDKITVLEALGLAGDLTPYSSRGNILVVREQDGIRRFGELNLQSADIFKSEFYYLKQGDIVYVEPTKYKEAEIRDQFAEYAPWISIAIQGITATVAVLGLINN